MRLSSPFMRLADKVHILNRKISTGMTKINFDRAQSPFGCVGDVADGYLYCRFACCLALAFPLGTFSMSPSCLLIDVLARSATTLDDARISI